MSKIYQWEHSEAEMEDVNKHMRSFPQRTRTMHFLPSDLLGGGRGTLAPSLQDRNHQPFWTVIWKNIKTTHAFDRGTLLGKLTLQKWNHLSITPF